MWHLASIRSDVVEETNRGVKIGQTRSEFENSGSKIKDFSEEIAYSVVST